MLGILQLGAYTLLWLLEFLGVTDPALRGNALTGLFGFLGVLITGLIALGTWVLNQLAARREQRRLRRERCVDLQLALWSEIHSIWRQCVSTDPQKSLPAKISQRFSEAKANKENYTPNVSSPPGSVVFDKIEGEAILLLEREEIPSVIAFYRHLNSLTAFAADLKSESYPALSLERKEAMLIHYINMGDMLEHYAVQCLDILEDKLDIDEKHRMRTVNPRVNSG